jgi:hypothetical protein
MPLIELNDTEMGQLMFVLANAEFKNGVTWALMNPLITSIAAQARAHNQSAQRQQGVPANPANMGLPPTRTDGMRPPFPPAMHEARPTLEVHDE